jgi:hypothetical protein
MSTPAEWDKWLAESDSVESLAPDGYDDHAAGVRARALGRRLTGALATYQVQRGSTELYQDSTGLVGHRVTAKGDTRPFAPTLAWVLLSHFGDLATVKDCHEPELLAKICGVLDELRLKYIPYDYAAAKQYDGKCRALLGFSWANRFFALCVDFNYDALPQCRIIPD